MSPGFETWKQHDFFLFIFFYVFLSLLLQCKFAISTLLPLLSFSFMTPYDAQASSAFSGFLSLAFTGIDVIDIKDTPVVIKIVHLTGILTVF